MAVRVGALAVRCRENEVMDDPRLERDRHHCALDGLERINYVSMVVPTLAEPILALQEELGGRPVKVLDVACGGGDVVIGLWQHGHERGVDLQVDGCDRSEVSVEHARTRAWQARAEVRFFELDAAGSQLPEGYDVIITTLFLHHLDDAQAVELLQGMAAACRRMLLANDLVRSPASWLLAWGATRLLTRSDVARVDGPRSVRAAFTIAEARDLARRAGLAGVTVEPRWPCRYLLTWRRP